jgi:phosphoketolase
VLAAAGDVALANVLKAQEMVASAWPRVKTRVVAVEDVARLSIDLGRGFDADTYSRLLGDDVPVVFNFTGYPATIRALVAGRPNAHLMTVVGYVDRTGHDYASNLEANGVAPAQLARLALNLAGRERERGSNGR